MTLLLLFGLLAVLIVLEMPVALAMGLAVVGLLIQIRPDPIAWLWIAAGSAAGGLAGAFADHCDGDRAECRRPGPGGRTCGHRLAQ